MATKIPFSPIETDILDSLLKKYESEIYNRKTDNHSRFTKEEAWMKITEEFNCMENITKRTKQQLHKKWENLRAGKKRTLCENKKIGMEIIAKPQIKIEDPDYTDSIASHAVVEEIACVYDIDTIVLPDVNFVLDSKTDMLLQKDDENLEPEKTLANKKKITLSRETSSSKRNYERKENAVEEELQSRLHHFNVMEKRENELHALKKIKLELDIAIAEQELKKKSNEAKIAELQYKKFLKDCSVNM